MLQEIYKDRKKFSKQVFEVASSDLVNMGITVVSYTLKDIRDDEVRTKTKDVPIDDGGPIIEFLRHASCTLNIFIFLFLEYRAGFLLPLEDFRSAKKQRI